MRLQVFLSRAGVLSRRAASGAIVSGRVRVNGQEVLEPGFRVSAAKDIVKLDDRRILPKKTLYVMLHKPKGVTTTKRDPFAARTVMDLLPDRFRHLNPVGRLDKDTTGLILFTNDGELINRLTHPRFNIEKTYAAELDRKLSAAHRIKIEKGFNLDGKYTAPCRIRLKHASGLEITMREGRKRQIKRMFLRFGYRVTALKRLKEGCLALGTLAEGKWRALTDKEIANLTNQSTTKVSS